MFGAIKVKTLAIAAALSVSVTCAEASEIEDQFWEFATTSGSVESLEAFIANYPDSDRVSEAEALIAGLQDDDRRRKLEQLIFDRVGTVRYDEPMNFGNDGTIGVSLSNIFTTAPMFPPIEGLPDEVWKDKTCTTCHQWTRADLCTQAKTYIAKKPVKYQEKQHPFWRHAENQHAQLGLGRLSVGTDFKTEF